LKLSRQVDRNGRKTARKWSFLLTAGESSPNVVRGPDFMPVFHGLQNMPIMPVLAIPEVRYIRKSQEVKGRKNILQK
jgi:hypothetical protein